MKDLTYLYEFEKLLESANNPLVQQACAEGKHALAYTCYHLSLIHISEPTRRS